MATPSCAGHGGAKVSKHPVYETVPKIIDQLRIKTNPHDPRVTQDDNVSKPSSMEFKSVNSQKTKMQSKCGGDYLKPVSS